MTFDMMITGAQIYDGTDTEPYIADVAIHRNRIAQIGELRKLPANKVVSGQGLALAPGFIDVHTHDDSNAILFPDCVAKITQGITTVITGNCGISIAPATLSGEVPDPMNLLGKKEDFRYPTFACFAKAVEQAKPAVNVAALIGHTTLRNNVMDDLFRSATVSEIELMRQTLSQAMKEGALGLSSGLAYSSAKQSTAKEVMQLAEVVGQFGGIYTTHMRTEFDEIIQAMEEAFETGRYAGVPVVISHLKCAGARNWGRTKEVLALLENVSQHQEVSCDCYPYSASSSTLDLAQVTEEIDILITWSDAKPEHAGKMLKEIAEEMNLPLLDAAKALQPAGAVYHCMDENDVKRVLKNKLTMVGSDGLPNDTHPHPRLWGSFPKVLGHYCREEKLFSLSEAIHKMTGMPAQRYKLKDRGVIKAGAYADLVLFNPNTIKDTATFENPVSASEGIESVFVNGSLTYSKGSEINNRFGVFIYRD